MCYWCESGDKWRFETTDLATGQIKAVLHPISAEWEIALSQPSTATLLLATQDPSQDDIYATETGLFISREIAPDVREAHWGGYIQNDGGEGGGSLTVAAVSMDEYLNHRLLADDDGGLRMDVAQAAVPPALPGTSIYKPVDTNPANDVRIYNLGDTTTAAVAYVLTLFTQPRQLNPNGNGIPLEPSVNIPIDNQWTETGFNWWEFKNIGQAIREMVEASPGLKYWLEHSYANGYWSSVIYFSDEIGVTRDYTLRSDYEGWKYGLLVDGKDKASRVYGIGGGTEATTQFSVAYDQAERMPEFQATVAWKDQTEPTIIDKLTAGYVADHRDPVAIPAMTLVGLPSDDEPGTGYPPPALLKPGDRFEVDIGYGAITVKDIQVKCLGVTSKLEQTKPLQRVIAMLPVVRPSESIKTQTPARSLDTPAAAPIEQQQGARTVDPWPTPGLITKIHPNFLHEISGTEISRTNPGFIWVHNDNEVGGDLGHMYLVQIAPGGGQGFVAGKFRINPGLMTGSSDFEAIRINPVNGLLSIGDFGDNDDTRNHGRLFVVPEPAGGGDKGILPNMSMVRLKYSFSGGWTNTEALLINHVGNYFTITKGENTRVVYFGPTPTDNQVGVTVATLNCTFVVDAVFTQNGQFVLIRTNHNQDTLVYTSDNPPAGMAAWTKVGAIPTPALPKGEGIAIEGTCSFIVTTEAKPHAPISETETPVYRVLIPTQFGATCGTVEGPTGTGGTGGQAPDGTIPGQVIDLTNWKLQLPIN